MISAKEIKSMVAGFGADQCGISGVERFNGAPAGFHPVEVWRNCKSVIVYVKRLPEETLVSDNPVVYSHASQLLYNELDRIGLNLSAALEKMKVHTVLVPTDVPYLFWDAERKHGMGVISMRHAAFNAGLGILGRNTLLINRSLGNLVVIGAVLIDAPLDSDPLTRDFSCPDDCDLCLEACPVKALDGITVNQKKCREFSTLEHPRGWDLYTCSACRQACPLMKGVS
jgi:epoxyqueuosine reductase